MAEENDAPKPRKGGSRPRAKRMVVKEKPTINGNPQEPSADTNQDQTNKSIRNATWVIAGTAAIGIVIAGLQWSILSETNRIAAIAQRPYIASTDIRLSDRQLPGYWMFDVLVTNSGGTPTRDMQYLAVSSEQQPNDPEVAFANPPGISQKDRGLVAPNATIALRLAGTGLPASVLTKMAKERAVLFLSGIVYYRNQSKDSPRYVTKYCFDVHPVIRGNKLTFGYNQCIHWNCMDADCITDRCIYEARKTEDDYSKAQEKCAGLSAKP